MADGAALADEVGGHERLAVARGQGVGAAEKGAAAISTHSPSLRWKSNSSRLPACQAVGSAGSGLPRASPGSSLPDAGLLVAGTVAGIRTFQLRLLR